jgi:hypothetical protein
MRARVVTTMRSFLVLPIFVVALPLVACGGATMENPDGGVGQDAGRGATADASLRDASSSPDASSPPDDAGDERTSTRDAGFVLLQAFGGASGEVAAQVPTLEPGVGQEETCASPVDAGACQLISCQLGGIGDPGGGYGNFGPMTASVGTATVDITYSGFGYPTVYFPSSVTLGTGGTMTFRGGDGGDVPTFDIPATIPGLGVITSPVPTTDGGAVIIDTSQDLSVTWLPISIGRINFGLYGGSESINGTAVTITCTFDGASGSGVVSQALLPSFKELSGPSGAYGSLGSELEVTTVVDGLTIETQSFQSSPATEHGFNVTFE